MKPSDSRLSDQYCVFRVGGADFAVAAADVREIVETVPIVAVPYAPSWLQGLGHLRNEFLPVLSLLSLVGESAADDAKFAYLLVIEGSEGAWAFSISQAMGLEKLELASTSGTHHDAQSRMVLGTASYRDRVVRILDTGRVYSSAAAFLDRAWSTEGSSPDLPDDVSPLLTAQTVG